MRLLTCSNVDDLRVTSDLADNEVPPYAILSHTWGKDEEEVKIQEIGSAVSRTKAGYAKIQYCGQQARGDGWQHFWVDTCCIDKTSSAELSKAITSMHRWYQDAQVCYVYLADVLLAESEQRQPSQRSWEASFRQSRWFTRGWTLQELLAPKNVVFYSKTWDRLGTKVELKGLLREITGIPIAALEGQPLSEFPVIERMRWTYGRKTKVKEDQAYCLLGIFDVFMYLNYGEGDNAFRRLQNEIDAQNLGVAALTLREPSPIGKPEPKLLGVCLASAPLIQPDEFVGRSSELDLMHNILRPDEHALEEKRVVLGGIGGIGKTQLAIAYARRHASSYTSVLWLNATSELTLSASFRSVAELLMAADELDKLDNKQTVARVREWLSQACNKGWLLIFDNYDDPELFDLKGYCPVVSHGSLIVTTRLPSKVVGTELRVSRLEILDDSLEILQLRSGRRDVRNDVGARHLAKRLAGLPLALATAGAYLYRTSITFQQYLDFYETRWQVDRRRPLSLREYQDRTIYTTWNLSYDRLKLDDPEAAEMLKLLAYFDNQEIWYDLFRAGLGESTSTSLPAFLLDQIDFESVMSTLVDYCFVDVQHSSSSCSIYSMHGCVHDWTLGVLNAEIDPKLYGFAFDCVTAGIDMHERAALGEMRYARLTRHAVRLTHHQFARCNCLGSRTSQDFDPWMAMWIALMLKEQAQFSAAEQMYLQILAWQERSPNSNDDPIFLLQSSISNNLGNVYKRCGKIELAEQMYRQASAGYEEAYGPSHTQTLSASTNLALLYRNQGKLEAAEQLFLRALAVHEEAPEPDNLEVLRIVKNIGLIYEMQGKLEIAEQMYMRVLAGLQEELGPDHVTTLKTVHNIGLLYKKQGRPEAAEQMYNRVLAGREKAYGPSHAKTIHVAERLGCLYLEQGRLEAAERNFQRVIDARTIALGADHPDTRYVAAQLDEVLSLKIEPSSGSEQT